MCGELLHTLVTSVQPNCFDYKGNVSADASLECGDLSPHSKDASASE